MLPHDLTQQPNGGPPVDQQDTGLEHLQEFQAIADELGNAIHQNASQAAMTDNPSDSKDFAQAALFATQALVALVPYRDPSAPNAPGDNPAKTGD